MATEAEVDDDQFSDEFDPETEALLYSRIHHQESIDEELSIMDEKNKSSLLDDIIEVKSTCVEYGLKLLQTDSGICSPKGSLSPSPLEEEKSRLQTISSTSKANELSSNSSSEEDDGIKIVFEHIKGLKESHITQKKNLRAYTEKWEPQNSSSESSSSSDGNEESQDLNIKLNIDSVKTKKRSFCSFESVVGEKSSLGKQIQKNKSWTEHMNQFYNDVNDTAKNKTLEEIWEELPDDPQLWEVNLEDRITFNSSFHERNRYFKKPLSRCANCRERGHSTRLCPSPRKQIKCSMCGGQHRETRCDQSMCLRCGEANRLYTRGCNRCLRLDKFRCSVCCCFGHETKTCPNTWRRFHLTTDAGDLVRVEKFVDPKDKWCANCAKKGHYLHQCPAYLVSSYPVSIGHVVEYSLEKFQENNRHVRPRGDLSKREIFKRNKSLAIKRKFFSKKVKKDDINPQILNSLISQAKKKEKRVKRRRAMNKKSGFENSLGYERKKSGKNR